MSDPEILEAIRNGRDHAAFVALYTHLPKVAHLVRQNSGSKDDAKDLFQDAPRSSTGKCATGISRSPPA
ncbi:MAG: hypothetical protein IPN38_15175 [Flavobacteriales bacterium]|nr:hypothetical protein [Flavobacteriales bacterium]